MSTVVYENGLRIFVNSKEAPHKGRPHCHVEKGSANMTVDLETLEVLSNNGQFSRGDAGRIQDLVKTNQEELKAKWEEYHGKQ